MSDIPQAVRDAVTRDTETQPAEIPAAVRQSVQRDTQAGPASPPPASPHIGPIPDAVKNAVAQDTGQTQESLIKRSGRRAVQELYSTLGAPQAIYGLAGAAIEAAFSDDIDFKDAMLSEDGRELVARAEAGDNVAIEQIKANPTALLRSGLHGAAEWYEEGGELAGVTNNPDGSVPLDEEVGGIVLSSLITLPASVISKPLSAVNKITNRTARIATKAALKGAELATPVTIGGPKSIAANIAVQQGINDVTRKLMDEPTLIGQVVGDDHTIGSVSPETGLPEEEGTGAEDALIAGGAVGAALLGMNAGRIARNVGARAGRLASSPTGTPELGNLPSRGPGEVAGDVGRNIGDEQGILVEGVRRTQGDDQAESFNDLLRANSGQSVHASYSRFDDMGILSSDGSVRTVPFKALKGEYGKLSADQQNVFNNAMLALDELSTRSQGGTTMGGVPRRTLNTAVALGRNDPQVERLIRMYDEVGRGFTEARFKRGMIDAAQKQKENATAYNPNTRGGNLTGYGGYVPFIEAKPPRTLFEAVGEAGTNANQRTLGGISASSFDRARTNANVNNVERMQPMEALENMARREVENMAHNTVRRDFLRRVANSSVNAFKNNRRIVERGAEGRGVPIKVLENGKEITYRVGDKRIAKALEFRPAATLPVATFARKMFQRGTTGALNPMFAPVSLAYDAMFGMLSARNDKIVTGVLDQGIAIGAKQAGMSDQAAIRLRQMLSGVTRPVELTATVLEGLITGSMGRIKMEYARHMMDMAAREYGNPTTARAAAKATDTFLRSKYGMMHMSGHPAHNHIDDFADADRVLSNLMSKAADNRVVRGYSHVLETVRDAYRMGIYSRNVAHHKLMNNGKIGQADYNKIARHTKEVASDPTRRGASDTINRITSATPYASVIMHSTAHLVAQVRNPAAYSVLGAITAARMVYLNSMSPEAREYIDTQVPDYRRYTFMPIEQEREEGEAFDPQQHLEFIPLGPELGTVTQMAVDLLGGMFEKQAEDNMDPGLSDRAIAGLADLFQFPTPPILNIAATGLGYGQIQPGAALDDRPLFRQGFTDGGMQEMRGTNLNAGWVTDRLHGMIYSALGTAGRTIMDSAEVMDSQMYLHDENFYEAADDAMEVFKYNAVERQTVGTLFSDTTTRMSLSNSLSDRAYEVDQAMEKLTDISRAVAPNISGLEDADIPMRDVINNMPNTVKGNPQLVNETLLVRRYFGNQMHASQMDHIGQLRKKYRRLSGDTQMSVDQRNTAMNDIATQMHERYDNVLKNYGEFEDMMIKHTGNPQWSLNDLVDRVEDYILHKR